MRVRKYDPKGSVVEVFDYSFVEGEEQLFMDNYKVYVYADEASTPQTFSQSVAHKSWVFRPDGTRGDWDRFGEHPEPQATASGMN